MLGGRTRKRCYSFLGDLRYLGSGRRLMEDIERKPTVRLKSLNAQQLQVKMQRGPSRLRLLYSLKHELLPHLSFDFLKPVLFCLPHLKTVSLSFFFFCCCCGFCSSIETPPPIPPPLPLPPISAFHFLLLGRCFAKVFNDANDFTAATEKIQIQPSGGLNQKCVFKPYSLRE